MNDKITSLTFSQIELITKNILNEYTEFCFLLGSATTPRFNKESDIDLAVYWKNSLLNPTLKKINFELQLQILNQLENEFHSEVDLVSLNNIDIIYGIQVVTTGKIIINNNPGLLLQWKTDQLSKYPDFKRSRSIIENNILNRKKYV